MQELFLMAPASTMIAKVNPGCASASFITNKLALSLVLPWPYQSMITPSMPRLIMS